MTALESGKNRLIKALIELSFKYDKYGNLIKSNSAGAMFRCELKPTSYNLQIRKPSGWINVVPNELQYSKFTILPHEFIYRIN